MYAFFLFEKIQFVTHTHARTHKHVPMANSCVDLYVYKFIS